MPQALAFHRACVDADFRDDPDQNHPESTGISPRARNTIDGVRISMAIAYLDPARHQAQPDLSRATSWCGASCLTAHAPLGSKSKALGSAYGGRGADRVEWWGHWLTPRAPALRGSSWSAAPACRGAVVYELPGVGQNLRDHPSARYSIGPKGQSPRSRRPRSRSGCAIQSKDRICKMICQISPMLNDERASAHPRTHQR